MKKRIYKFLKLFSQTLCLTLYLVFIANLFVFVITKLFINKAVRFHGGGIYLNNRLIGLNLIDSNFAVIGIFIFLMIMLYHNKKI